MGNADIREHLETEFKNKNVSVTLFPEKNSIKFDGIQHFYDFINTEMSFWGFAQKGDTLNEIKARFNGIFNKLTGALNETTNIQSAKTQLNEAISRASENQFPCVYSVTDKAKFIKVLYERHPARAEGACKYLKGEALHSYLGNDNNNMAGYVSAVIEDSNELCPESISVKEKALDDLKERYVSELNGLHAKYKEKHAEYVDKLSTINTQYDEFKNQIEGWSKSEQEKLRLFINEKEAKVSDLEKTYEDKLRLEAPATYWNDSKDAYKEIGDTWKKWALGSASVLIILLTAILYELPAALAMDKFSLGGVRAAIILAVIISVGIYIVRLFVKLSISAYHLSRDADERYQLTHVYLSLLHEKGVSDADRAIVLQALFSRADTGLLKGDSGPTMPGPMGDIAKNLGGQH